MLLAWLAGMLIVARDTKAADKATINAVKGETYYTQFSLYQEKQIHLATNYRKGALVPINTAVVFEKASGTDIYVKLPDGSELKISNVPAFSGETVEGIFRRTLGREKVNLEKFSAEEKENILHGTVAVGMAKEAVLKAIGYPPRHQTPSLEGDQWRYWHNRLITFIVNFEGGKVSSIKG